MPIEERIRDSAVVRAAPAVDGLWERQRTAALAGPAVLLLLTVCLCWKLTLTNQFTWMDHPDAANQVLPWLEFQAREWRHGRVPLWEPFNWGGQPLVGRMEPGAAYPLNWLLFAMPAKDGFLAWGVLHWYFSLIHFPAALGCYWLCRDLKRSRAASVLAGVAFGLGGYVGRAGWPQKVNSAVWTPLAILFFLRGMRGERPLASACLSGGFLGMANTYYPGWQATVDGEPAAILEVNGALRGVVAGPGRHVIHMKYRPAATIAGAFLSACGFLGMVVLLWRRGNRPAKIR